MRLEAAEEEVVNQVIGLMEVSTENTRAINTLKASQRQLIEVLRNGQRMTRPASSRGDPS